MDDALTVRINESGTLDFAGGCLSRDPVVLRGFTSDEVLWAGAAGAALGLPFGGLLWWLSGQMPLLPSGMVAGLFLMLFFGGRLLRRLKRGKPDTFVYRQLHFLLARQFTLSLGEKLITRSGFWTIRRRLFYRLKRAAFAETDDGREAFA